MLSKLSFLAGAALLAVAALPAPAAARSELIVRQVRVSYDDLDLRSSVGAQTMLARIDGGARRVCRDLLATGPMELRNPKGHQKCRARAVANAVADLDAPLVALAHAKRLGASTEVAAR